MGFFPKNMFRFDRLLRAGRLRLVISVPVVVALLKSLSSGSAAFAQVQDQLRWIPLEPEQPRFALLDKQELKSVKVDPQLLGDVRQLEDDSFPVREEATKRLVQASTNNMIQLYAVLASDELSTEQRYRLLTVVRETLVRAPRGALGVSTNPVMQMQMQMQVQGQVPMNPDEPTGVKVDAFIDGLPAERVLQIGDWITRIDGKPLVQWDDLKFCVESKRPGEKVQLTVMRPKVDADGKALLNQNKKKIYDTMQLEVELGSAELLKEFRTRAHQPVDTPSRLERSRLSEANAVMQQFSPALRAIPVHGGASALYTKTVRKAGKPAPDDEDSSAEAAIDRNPAIKQLLTERRLIAQGLQPETPALRMLWQERLIELSAMLQEPTLSDDQHTYLERVIKRYVELMDTHSK